MTSPAEPQLEAVCPYCRGKIRLPADPEIERVRCPRCNENIPLVLLEVRVSSAPQIVSEANTASMTGQAAALPAAIPPPPPPPKPQEVRVKCRLCGTLVYVPLSEVGKETKCPDCDFMNVVPEPPKPQKKFELKLEEGDTFNLLQGVDQPEQQSASRQQKWYMAKCPTCFTDIRLTVDHAGKEVKCPDCLTTFTAAQPPPEPKQPQKKANDDDAYELKLSEPVERPPIDVEDLIGSRQVPVGEELRAASSRGELNTREKLQSLHGMVKGEKPPESEADDSPDMDLAPLPEPIIAPPAPKKPAQAAAPSLAKPAAQSTPAAKGSGNSRWRDEPPPGDTSAAAAPSATATAANTPSDETPAAPKRPRFRISATTQFLKKLLLADLWTFTSDTGLIARWVALSLLIGGTLWIGALTINVFQESMNPMSSIMMLIQSTFSALLILFCLILIANTFLPIVISAGLEQQYVEDWPGFNAAEWVMQVFYIVNALAVGALPTIFFVPLFSVPVLAFLQWLTIVPLFPIAILSMLDEGSAFAPYAPAFWRLISIRRGLWLRFTAVGYVMAAVGMLFAGLTIYTASAILAVVSGFVIASLIVVYARFLGRMALFMSEQSITEDLDDDEE